MSTRPGTERRHDGRSPARRHRAREVALRVLFEIEGTSKDPEQALHYQAQDMSAPPDVVSYACTLVLGCLEHREAVDSAIVSASAHWKLEDLGKVERALLRLSVYELMFQPGTPTPVAIDEAVELARTYAGEEARSYVNGVLGNIAAMGGS